MVRGRLQTQANGLPSRREVMPGRALRYRVECVAITANSGGTADKLRPVLGMGFLFSKKE